MDLEILDVAAQSLHELNPSRHSDILFRAVEPNSTLRGPSFPFGQLSVQFELEFVILVSTKIISKMVWRSLESF